jgi:hypothetical protein
MASRHRDVGKWVALLTVLCLMQAYVFAGPTGSPTFIESSVAASQQVGATLKTTGNQPVTVNGNSAGSGTTVLPGASIETPAGVGATLQMGFAVLDISPDTELSVDFSPGGPVTVTLKRGCVVLRTTGDAEGTIITPDGGTVKTGDDKRAEVCHNRRGPTGGTQGGGGVSNGAILALLAGATAATFVALLLPGRGENPSPSAP